MNDEASPKKKLGRRRRANVAGGRRHSHRVLVTEHEEARLAQLAEAQRVTVPRLLIESTLAGPGETSTQRRDAMTKLFAVRRDLAGVATNVNQLARLGNTDGRVPVGTAAALASIREVVERIDAAIDGLAS
jgi:Bacterial mobilisation protein (MobC)